MSKLTYTTMNAIRNAKAFKDAYDKAERAAVKGIVTDVLGDEWTKKQFDAVESWDDVLAAHYLSGAIVVPSVDTLRAYGWVEYRVEEFELPEHVKREIAANTVTITFDDGYTLTEKVPIWNMPTVGDVSSKGRIVKVEEARPDFKGRRYIYRFV